jgi:hypothetical protein
MRFSLKIPSTFGSSEMVEVNETTFLDPRVNKQYVATSNMTAGQFLAVLKAIYTPENILGAPTFFFQTTTIHSSVHNDFVSFLVSRVPADKLWLLFFWNVEGSSQGRTYLYGQFRTPRLYQDRTRLSLDTNDRWFQPEVPFQDDTWWDMFKTQVLQPLETEWNTFVFIQENLSKRWLPDNFNGFAPPLRAFLNFTNGANYCYYPATETSVSAGYLASVLFPENPTAKLSITFGPYGVEVQFSVPVDKRNKSPLYHVFNYSHNVLQTLPYPLTCKGEFNPPLFGVELEVATDYNVRQIIDATDEPFMLAKQDGSITGSKRNRMELVTVPMSLKAHKREWARWFSKLDYDKFDCTKSTTNGMHVHVGREFFTSKAHLRNFIWFFNNPANYDFLLMVSERNASSMAQYCSQMHIPPSYSKTRAYREGERLVDRTGRNLVTNVKKGPTVEVRLFRGLVSYASVLKNLEMVDAVLSFTAQVSMKDADLRTFLAWMQGTHANKYTVLKKFLKMSKLDTVLLSAEIKDVIFMEAEPTRIANKLRESKLKITQAHITYLNKWRKKRTFVLDSKTGELSVVQTDLGKVAAFDRDLEKRYVNAA